MKRLVSIICIITMLLCTINVFAEETDYSYLEDMTVKELKELDKAIHELLGDSVDLSNNEIDTDSYNVNDSEISDDNNNAPTSKYVVEGRYYDNCGIGDYYIDIFPSNDEKTEGTLTVCDSTGSNTYDYRIESNYLYYSTNSYDYAYEIYKTYLIPNECNLTGTIPDGFRFNAELSNSTRNYRLEYYFYEDSFFKIIDTRVKESYGIYDRVNDNTLDLNYDGKTVRFFIRDGIANDSVYRKMKR